FFQAEDGIRDATVTGVQTCGSSDLAGTRLWPAARRHSPKQLQRLIFEQPLIAETVERLARFYPRERILIVTAQRYADPIREVLQIGRASCRERVESSGVEASVGREE